MFVSINEPPVECHVDWDRGVRNIVTPGATLHCKHKEWTSIIEETLARGPEATEGFEFSCGLVVSTVAWEPFYEAVVYAESHLALTNGRLELIGRDDAPARATRAVLGYTTPNLPIARHIHRLRAAHANADRQLWDIIFAIDDHCPALGSELAKEITRHLKGLDSLLPEFEVHPRRWYSSDKYRAEMHDVGVSYNPLGADVILRMPLSGIAQTDAQERKIRARAAKTWAAHNGFRKVCLRRAYTPEPPKQEEGDVFEPEDDLPF